jgi:hypothetical protein
VVSFPSAQSNLGLTEFQQSYQLLDDAVRVALKEASEFDVQQLGRVRDKHGANGETPAD